MPAVMPVAAPAEYEPVAMGILEPILSLAFWPSVARMLGFCRTRVSASESSALSVPPEMLTEKLVALRLARVLRVKLELLGVLVPLVLVLVLEDAAVVVLACGVSPKDWGRVMPRLRILSR